jgi:hypothetical protein
VGTCAAICLAITGLQWLVVAPVRAESPTWEVLQLGVPIPEDALRVWGNTRPLGKQEYADRAWRQAERSSKGARQKIAQFEKDPTERAARYVATARETLASQNAVVCLSIYDGALAPGVLSVEDGVCRLEASVDGDDYRCRDASKTTPDCVPNIPIASGRVFVLRHANQVHLIDLLMQQGKQHFGDEALVGISQGSAYGVTPALCIFHTFRHPGLGTVARNANGRLCESRHRKMRSNQGAPLGYGDKAGFLAVALAPLREHLLEQALPKLQGQRPEPALINTVQDGEARLAALDAALEDFQQGLQAPLSKLGALAQAEGARVVQEVASEAIASLMESRGHLVQRLEVLRIEADVAAFRSKHLDRLVRLLSPLEEQDLNKRPDKLARATDERTKLRGVLLKAAAIVDNVSKLVPERAVGAATSLVHEKLTPYLALGAKRLATLDTCIEVETKKLPLDAVAAEAQALVATLATPPGDTQSADEALVALEGLHGRIVATLAKAEANAEVAAYGGTLLDPLRASLEELGRSLEPHLGPALRVERFEGYSATLRKEVALVEPIRNALAALDRLFKTEDSGDTQAVMLSELIDLRRALTDDMAMQIAYIYDCENMIDDCEVDEDTSAYAFALRLNHLPASPKVRPKSEETRQFKRVLDSLGLTWEATEPSDTGDTYGGPQIEPRVGWIAQRFKGRLRPALKNWLECRGRQALGKIGKHARWLAACHKAGDALSEGKARSLIEESVHTEIGHFAGQMSAKKCKSIHWDRRRSFFGKKLEAVCQEIATKEKRASAISSAEKAVRAHIKRKQYSKAYKALERLSKAGAEGWRISSARSSIETAQAHNADQKLRRAAEKRARQLMRRLPSFERTCRSMSRKHDNAVARIKRAVRNGRPSTAERFRKEKVAAGRKACAAQAKVHEVHTLYESQGNSVAAQEVFDAARTCVRVWRCR